MFTGYYTLFSMKFNNTIIWKMIDMVQVLIFSVCELICKLKGMQLLQTFKVMLNVICIYRDTYVLNSKCKGEVGEGGLEFVKTRQMYHI